MHVKSTLLPAHLNLLLFSTQPPNGVEKMTAYLTQQAIERFAAALQADKYNVRLLNPETDEARAFPYTPAQLTSPKTVAFLRLQNRLGFNVYARPVGWQYVLLDDLTRPALADLKTDDVRPCLLIETSPDNFQAWVILPDVPADRAEAKAIICRSGAEAYRADPASAEPDHVGRLPGFTNRKPTYRQRVFSFRWTAPRRIPAG